jgi:hypothetical protein
MSDNQSKSRPTASPWIVAALVLLPSYVALSGPACWLATRGYFYATLHYLYSPLFLIGDHCRPIRDVLHWYWKFWGM